MRVEGVNRICPPAALFASLEALQSVSEWLLQLKCYKTKMQIGCKKAPCWQNMNLVHTFTLSVTPLLGSEWSGRVFPPGTHIKDKLQLLNQKQVITVISFIIASLNPSWVLLSYVYEWNVLKPQHLLPFRRAALPRDNTAIMTSHFRSAFCFSKIFWLPRNISYLLQLKQNDYSFLLPALQRQIVTPASAAAQGQRLTPARPRDGSEVLAGPRVSQAPRRRWAHPCRYSQTRLFYAPNQQSAVADALQTVQVWDGK